MKKYVHLGTREGTLRTRNEAKEFQQQVIDDLEHTHRHVMEQLERDHGTKLDKVKQQHQDQLDSIRSPLVEVKKNEGPKPKDLGNGVIVLPGDYYIVDGAVPTGIQADEFERNWAEATDDD